MRYIRHYNKAPNTEKWKVLRSRQTNHFPISRYSPLDAPASIARPAYSSTRHLVPVNYNKLAAVVTRAGVDLIEIVGAETMARRA